MLSEDSDRSNGTGPDESGGGVPHYVESGRIGLLGPLLMLLATAAGALAVGTPYAFWMHWMHPVLKLPAPIAYGAAIGFFVGYAARTGKVQNSAFVGRAGAAGGVAGWYASSLVWLMLYGNYGDIAPLGPAPLFEKLGEAAALGVGATEKQRFRGLALWALWTLEFLAILAYARYAALKTSTPRPAD